MTVLETDLTAATDLELDVGLRRLFNDHRAAVGDARAEIHAAIAEIIDEQSRRLGLWLEEKR